MKQPPGSGSRSGLNFPLGLLASKKLYIKKFFKAGTTGVVEFSRA
jgi:hypothetical protein